MPAIYGYNLDIQRELPGGVAVTLGYVGSRLLHMSIGGVSSPGGTTPTAMVNINQLPISVLDKEGRPVNGLTKDHFQIFEDKIQQTIKTFKHEDIPLSIGLIIDNSGSMRNKRERVNSSALAFVRESNPEDETFIVNFDDSAYLEQDFTGSIGDLIEH